MSFSFLDLLTLAAVGMPLLALVSSAHRIVQRRRNLLLAAAGVLVAINEIVFAASGIVYYVFHVQLDSLALVVAGYILASLREPDEPLPRDFKALAAAPLVWFAVSIFWYISQPQQAMLIAGISLLCTAVIVSYMLYRRSEELPGIEYAIISLWVLAHFDMYRQYPLVNDFFTFLLFATIAASIGIIELKARLNLEGENAILVRARDVVLSMLNDISSSVKNIASVSYTLERILQTINETLNVEGAAVFTLVAKGSDQQQVLSYSQSDGLFWPMHSEAAEVFARQAAAREHLRNTTFKIGEGLVGRVAQRQNTYALDRQGNPEEMKALGLNTRVIRNVLAVPLRVKEQVLGVLIVQNHREETSFGPNEMHLLRALADQAAISINNARMYSELAHTDRLRQEMRIASDVQRQSLPQKIPKVENLSISAFIRPAMEVGGDYYDFLETHSTDLGIVIGDVAGKGIPAGMMMVIARTVLEIVAREADQCRDIVIQFSKEMYPKMHRGQFMTLNYLQWNSDERRLTFAAAGHEHLLWYHGESGEVERIKAGGIAVGLLDDPAEYIKQRDLIAGPKDVFMLYTDGITEARDQGTGQFGLDRLEDSLRTHAILGDPDSISRAVIADVQAFTKGADQYDDMTLLILSVK
jgi:serine phosphatase RsbU (regulator of sigma subunit)